MGRKVIGLLKVNRSCVCSRCEVESAFFQIFSSFNDCYLASFTDFSQLLLIFPMCSQVSPFGLVHVSTMRSIVHSPGRYKD